MTRIVTGLLEVLLVAVCAYVVGYQRAVATRYKKEQKEHEQLENVWQRVHALPADAVRHCLQPSAGQK